MFNYDENSDAIECPFCLSQQPCNHLLLVVDQTFRAAEDGLLMDAFNACWNKQCEDGGDDFDERDGFENLLADVHSLADEFVEYDHDSGPGLSSSYLFFYVRSLDSCYIERFGKTQLSISPQQHKENS